MGFFVVVDFIVEVDDEDFVEDVDNGIVDVVVGTRGSMHWMSSSLQSVPDVSDSFFNIRVRFHLKSFYFSSIFGRNHSHDLDQNIYPVV